DWRLSAVAAREQGAAFCRWARAARSPTGVFIIFAPLHSREMQGATIGPYQVMRELGRGGMGEVYLARDTKLGRQVAIKALPAHLAENAELLARFEREAKLFAALNHSGIGAIYGSSRTGRATEGPSASFVRPRRRTQMSCSVMWQPERSSHSSRL